MCSNIMTLLYRVSVGSHGQSNLVLAFTALTDVINSIWVAVNHVLFFYLVISKITDSIFLRSLKCFMVTLEATEVEVSYNKFCNVRLKGEQW